MSQYSRVASQGVSIASEVKKFWVFSCVSFENLKYFFLQCSDDGLQYFSGSSFNLSPICTEGPKNLSKKAKTPLEEVVTDDVLFQIPQNHPDGVDFISYKSRRGSLAHWSFSCFFRLSIYKKLWNKKKSAVKRNRGDFRQRGTRRGQTFKTKDILYHM